MRFLRIATALVVPFILATTLAGQSLGAQLQRALQREMATGDHKAASAEYKRIADRAGSDAALAGQALLHRAEALEKLGDAEARKVYEQIVARHPEQPVAATARERLASRSATVDVPVGLWRGVATQSDGQSIPVEITITGGRIGSIVGSVAYPNPNGNSVDAPGGGCGGEVTLRSTEPGLIVLSERLTYGQSHCVNNGIVSLNALQNGAVDYQWSKATFHGTAQGILTKALGDDEKPVRLVWVDRAGKERSNVGAPGAYRGIDLSRDGQRLVLHLHTSRGGDIWTGGARGGTLSRLTTGPDTTVHNVSPIWSPDGTQIAFSSYRRGKWGLYRARVDKAGSEERLLESSAPIVPMAWVADHPLIAYRLQGEKTGADVWALPLSGDRKPYALMQMPFNENQPQVSPDGRWVAYFGNESGSQQVHIRPFPSGDGHWQVSTAGGAFPRWRGDGNELYFFSSANNGTVMAVSITVAGTSIGVGTPRALFESGYPNLKHEDGLNFHPYAVSQDGQMFLIPRP